MSRLATLKSVFMRARHSRRAGKVLSIALLVLIVGLLIMLARRIEWADVWRALAGYDALTLLMALAGMVVSYAVYSSFDLIGRHYTGHALTTPQVMMVGWVSYAFNQSLTAWVGGIAVRYRLYARHGIATSVIAQIFAISVLTNWVGYIALGSVVTLAGSLPLPSSWAPPVVMRLVGIMLAGAVGAYFYWNYRYEGRAVTLFGHQWQALGLRTALLQTALGATNWLLMAAVIYVLLGQQIAYPTVLSILLLSAVSAVVLHIPAGLGVVEGLFLTLLHDQLPRSAILAAMIAYRAIYFLLPLVPAAVIYFSKEMGKKGIAQRQQS